MEKKLKQQLIDEAWKDSGLAMQTSILETLIDIRDVLVNLEKAVREPHYDTNDGAIRVSITK